ncbi:MAG: radical SAM protein [Elusimicrobiota bacterium]|jgi:radical SAM superfamily enzyme YgiQ (UPF0313 family)
MDILLIFPPTSLSEDKGPKVLGRRGGNMAPLGLASVAGYLRHKGFEVAILDCPATGRSIDEAVSDSLAQKPRAIGISATSYVYPAAGELATRLRLASPDTLLILGGPHANIEHSGPLAEYPALDLVCFDEGELTSCELMEAFQRHGFDRAMLLADQRCLGKIEGLSFRKPDGSVHENPRRPPILDLDTLPLPARDLLPMDRYLPFPMYYKRKPVVSMVVSRGCPFACTFCDQGSLSSQKVRLRSPKAVVAEMRQLMDRHGAREISFWDDGLTSVNPWIRELCSQLIKERLPLIWNCYSAVRSVDQELLKRMAEAGCWKVYYGVETGNSDLMSFVKIDRKNRNLDQVRQAVAWTKSAGMEVHLAFMLGLPGEDPAKARNTIDFAIELDPDYAQFSLTTVYPGTELHQRVKDFGTLLSKDWKDLHGWEAVFLPRGYESQAQLRAMLKKAYASFFLRPGYILKKLGSLRSWGDVRRHYHGFRILTDSFLLRRSSQGFNVRG